MEVEHQRRGTASNLSRYLVMGILLLVEFVRGAYLLTYLPNFAVHSLGFGVSTVGIAVSAHYVTDTLLKSWIGWLVDRYPTRITIFVGMLVSFAGLWGMNSSTHSLWLILSSAIFGIGVSPIWLTAMGMATQVEDRATQMGSIYVSWLIGMGSGPVVMNFLMVRSITTAFWLMVGLWTLALVLSLGIRDQPKNWKPQSLQSIYKQLAHTVRHMRHLVPGMIFQTLAAGALVPILPLFATGTLHITQDQYGYVMIAGGVATVLFLVPSGKLSDRFGIRPFLLLGFAGSGLSILGLSLVKGLPMAILIALLIGISYALLLPAWNATLARRIPPSQEGVGWGTFSSLEGIGVMLGPALGGWVAERLGQVWVIYGSGGLFVIMALFYLVYSDRASAVR